MEQSVKGGQLLAPQRDHQDQSTVYNFFLC